MNIRLALATTSLFISTSAFADATTITSTQVDINFDPDSFLLQVEMPSSSFGSPVLTTLPSGSASVTGVANGVDIDFHGNMKVSADSAINFASDSRNGNYSIPLSFSAHPGFNIVSYTITYSGVYSLFNIGSVSAGGTGTSFSDSVYNSSGPLDSPFSVSTTIAGAVLPTIGGSIGATAEYGTIQVYDGSTSEYDHTDYQQTCDATGYCTTIETPIYVEVPHYHDEGVIGSSDISLESIHITANVAAVPEPETYAMFLAGLSILAAYRRRTDKRA